jgi:hypothetical protein
MDQSSVAFRAWGRGWSWARVFVGWARDYTDAMIRPHETVPGRWTRPSMACRTGRRTLLALAEGPASQLASTAVEARFSRAVSYVRRSRHIY